MSDSYKRVMLKISGEALMGARDYGFDHDILARIADELKTIHQLGHEVCVVIGGGNIFRGMSGEKVGVDRVTGDHMGMLGTVINALALQNALSRLNVPAVVMSSISMPTICEPYINRHGMGHLAAGRVVIFAGGTGNPFFSTDTAAALRASEMNCDVILKATQVDGVYSADPKKVKDAVRYDRLTFTEVLARDLRVMDAAAIALARENKIPILIFNLAQEGGLVEVVSGRGTKTVIAA